MQIQAAGCLEEGKSRGTFTQLILLPLSVFIHSNRFNVNGNSIRTLCTGVIVGYRDSKCEIAGAVRTKDLSKTCCC